MEESKGSVIEAVGAVFAACMMAVLLLLNIFFSIYITPVLAEAAGGQVWDPEVMRFIMYGLNVGFTLVTLAAVYCFYLVNRSLRAGRVHKAMAHGLWSLGLAVASVVLLGVHLFICLGYIVIWMPSS